MLKGLYCKFYISKLCLHKLKSTQSKQHNINFLELESQYPSSNIEKTVEVFFNHQGQLFNNFGHASRSHIDNVIIPLKNMLELNIYAI